MAEATCNKKTVVQKTVTLTLTVEEAETLVAVGAKIGGDREKSPRKHFASIMKALTSAGVRDYWNGADHPYKSLGSGSLHFSVTPAKEDRNFIHF